jgi:hypothetical protein
MCAEIRRAVGVAAALALLCARPAGAQAAASATVSGIVRDSSDAVVAGAVVRVRNHETNQTVDTTTDAQGRYRLLYVPVGDYHLSADAPGFATANVNLTLSVGAALDVAVVLKPAAVVESVDVVTPAPLVEASRTQVAARVTPQEIDSLPLNGRNYLDLALLAPNVSRTNTRSNDRFAETSAVPGSGISVAGQRNLGNTFIVDGLSANDDAADLAGTYYGEEVIREFQVITSGGTAEFGRASAGTINIVTQSGTNHIRGRGYGFFRNDRLDARNALAAVKDPLRQNQYGFSLGGPLHRDRTFWFANLERTAQDKTGIVTIARPDAAAINQAFDALGYRGPRIGTGAFSTGYHTINLFGRLDHEAGAAGRVELRYSVYDVSSPNARGVGGLSDVSRGTRLDNRDQTGAVNLQSSWSPILINEARAQFTHSRLSAPVNDPMGPAFTVSGVALSGTSVSSPTARDLDVIQAADTLTLVRGAHLMKAGADLLYNRTTIVFPGALQGAYTFSSVANLQRGAYVQFQQAFGDAALFQANPNVGVFVQDQWRARRGVTIDAGIRYDLQWLRRPVQLDSNNVSPRVGLAWAPGDQQTVVRASAGLFFDRIPLRATSNAIQRDGINYKVAVLSFGQAGAPVFPAILPAFPAGIVTAVSSIDPHIQAGYSQQAAVQFERALGHLASATVGYSYLRGHDIIMQRNINVPTLTAAQAAARGIANLGRPDPDFGNISQYQSIGDAWFHGLTLSLATRNLKWGSARASYTLSRALDDAGNAFFQTPQDNFDVLADKGPSDNDQRHRLVLSGTVTRAPAGLQIGYVLSYATGVPFNPVTGTDRNNDTTVNDRPAGAGRNSARQPSTSSFDLRVSRAFLFARRHKIDVIAEAFNLFDHFNVLNVNNTFGTGPTPNATYGQPTVAGDPRQLQLGVRWSF